MSRVLDRRQQLPITNYQLLITKYPSPRPSDKEQNSMTKTAAHAAPHIKPEPLKKMINRLIKAAPARKEAQPLDPLARLIRAFLEYDCDAARTEVAERKVQENMV